MEKIEPEMEKIESEILDPGSGIKIQDPQYLEHRKHFSRLEEFSVEACPLATERNHANVCSFLGCNNVFFFFNKFDNLW